jgi:hypothetical protein
MKKFKIYILLFVFTISFSSCLVDDETATDDFGKGPNLIGFIKSSIAANALADGSTTEVMVPLLVTGPTSLDITEDISFSVEVDASSTAIEGTHYTLNSDNLILSADEGLETSLPVTIITEGIVPPLAEAPTLVLNLTTTNNNAVVSGRTGQVTIDINYLCFSNLAGEYVINYTSGPQDITITQVSDGVYRASYFPTFVSSYWWEFSDVCNELTITDWQYDGSNPITGTSGPRPKGTIDEFGNITFTGINVGGVSWYVDYGWTILKK